MSKHKQQMITLLSIIIKPKLFCPEPADTCLTASPTLNSSQLQLHTETFITLSSRVGVFKGTKALKRALLLQTIVS